MRGMDGWVGGESKNMRKVVGMLEGKGDASDVPFK